MQDLLARNIRLSVTISLLIASSLLLVATIISTKQNELLNVIGLSISTSGLATSLVQIIEQLTERIEIFQST